MRRCSIVSWSPTDVLDKETGYKNRIFRKVYTVVISSEIPQSDLYGGSIVLSVDGTITEYDSDNPDLATTVLEDF